MENNVNEVRHLFCGLSEALQLWIDITGIDPAKAKGVWTWNTVTVMDLHEALKEALELDDTQVTGLMMFDLVAKEYCDSRTFSVTELFEEPERVADYVAKVRQLIAYLRSDDKEEVAKDFITRVDRAVRQYGVVNDETLSFVQKRHQIAIIQRDAFRTMKNLRVDQFFNGDPEPDGFKPVYGKFIYKWWNVNSMLEASMGMPSGVTVNLIKHPTNAFRSYFAFVIKNGGKLFVFTDKEQTEHPLAEDMFRRPEKVMANRSYRNWFPYDLVGLDYDDDGKPFMRRIDEHGVIPYQQTVVPIKAISELQPPEVVWIAMMLDMIVEKFWRQGYVAPKLSYTGEMTRTAGLLEAAAERNAVAVVGYVPLEVKEFTVEDVAEATIDELGLKEEPSRVNSWMEERYGHVVNAESLNVIGETKTTLALEFAPDGTTALAKVQVPAHYSLSSAVSQFRKKYLELDVFDGTHYGTEDEVRKDQMFIARANYAAQIYRAACAEFDAREKEIRDWFLGKVKANFPALERQIGVGEMWIKTEMDVRGFGRQGAYTVHDKANNTTKFLAIKELETDDDHRYAHNCAPGSLVFNSGFAGLKRRCYTTGSVASFIAKFHPETPKDIAYLAGCELSDLPDVLQFWSMLEEYHGNSILNRVDPMLWKCNNPWNKFTFEVVFFISKRQMAKLRKNHLSTVDRA